jgi:stage II sporulation protein R
MRRLCHHFVYRVWKWLFGLMLLFVLVFPSGGASHALGRAGGPIPEDAIRIRIVAHSDASFDQQVKRDVQSRIADEITSWGHMPGTHDEARALIASRLADVQSAADRALARWDAGYGAEMTFGDAPFPAKTFAGREYAAGNYEALYVQLGGGQGANWWCVLFPPLCLTAAAAPAADEEASTAQQATDAADEADDRAAGEDTEQAKSKAKFFIALLLQKLGAWLKALLH